MFQKIDRETWKRTEYFDHYFSNIPCTYSMTVKLDITQMRKKGTRLYPGMLYGLTSIVNRHPEFRTAINEKGELGIYDEMLPSYTIFHKDTETFSELWTSYDPDFEVFQRAYEADLRNYGHKQGMIGKPDMPENVFPVSMIPWTSFEGFHLNLQKGYAYLLPIFTMGKYYREGEQVILPLAVQVHHAVCDGFHVSRFVHELQELIDQW